MAGEYRISAYEGTPGAVIDFAAEGFTADYGGVTSNYSSSSPAVGSTCMTITGQGGHTYDMAFPSRVYWTGWWRSDTTPDSNRLIVDLQAGSSTQASLSIDTARKWRIRNQAGAATAISTMTFTVGTWYGMVWWADSATGQQELKIYSLAGALLETLSGGCGTTAFTKQREGILQGSATWTCSYDHTAVGPNPIALTFPSSGVEEHVGSASLEGAGSLSATGVARLSAKGALGLAGDGTLTASGTALLHAVGDVTLGGSGSLTAVGLARLVAFGELETSGAGTLSVAAIPSLKALAALSGDSALSLAASVHLRASQALSGTGTLGADASPSVSRTAPLSGEGDLTATASLNLTAEASFSGNGTLSVAAAASEHAVGIADLSGEGLLDGSPIVHLEAVATLGGAGSLEVKASSRNAAQASFDGSGTLTPESLRVALRSTAIITGAGQLSLRAAPAHRGAVGLSGAGTLQASAGQQGSGRMELNGTGALKLSATPGWRWVMILPSTGTLTASGRALSHYTAHAQLDGDGALTAQRTFTIPRDITVTARLIPPVERSATLPANSRWSARLQ